MSQQELHSQVSEDATADLSHQPNNREARPQPNWMAAGQDQQGANRGQGQTRVGKKNAPDTKSVDSGYSESSFTSTLYQEEPSITLGRNHCRGNESQPSGQFPDSISRNRSEMLTSASPSVRNLVDNVSLSSSSSALFGPVSESSASLASNLESVKQESITDDEVGEYTWAMPYDLKEEYQDAMILYSDLDRKDVDIFHSSLIKQVRLRDKKPPKVIMLDDFAVSIGSKIKTLEFGLERCTYVFIFLTENFINDTWAEFSGETCLMEAIYNPEKRWCVVPVFTQPKRNCTFKVPSSINSLKGVQYWSGPSDKFYNDSVKKLLDEKLHIRKRNEALLRKNRRSWLKEYKTKELLKKIKEQQEEQMEQERLDAQIRHAQSMPNMMQRQQKVPLYSSISMPPSTHVNNQLQNVNNCQHLNQHQHECSYQQVTETQPPKDQTQHQDLVSSASMFTGCGSSSSLPYPVQENVQSASSGNSMSSLAIDEGHIQLDSNVVTDALGSLRQPSTNHSAEQEHGSREMESIASHQNIRQCMTGNVSEVRPASQGNQAIAGPQMMLESRGGQLMDNVHMRSMGSMVCPQNRQMSDQVPLRSMEAMDRHQSVPSNMAGIVSGQTQFTQNNQARISLQTTSGMAAEACPQNMLPKITGQQTIQQPTRGTKPLIGPQNIPQNMASNLMQQDGLGLDYTAYTTTPIMQTGPILSRSDISGMRPDVGGMKPDVGGMRPDVGGMRPDIGGMRPDIGGMRPDVGGMRPDVGGMRPDIGGMRPDVGGTILDVDGLQGMDYGIKQVHIHHHYYPPNAEQQRPLNIINPGVVQIGESNVVTGSTDGLPTTAAAEEMERSYSEAPEVESSLIEESDRGLHSNTFRNNSNILTPRDQSPGSGSSSKLSQDNLPSDDAAASRRGQAAYSLQRYNPGLQITQVKQVDDLATQHVPPSCSGQQANDPRMALMDPEAAAFQAMNNPPLQAFPKPVGVASAMQRVRGTTTVATRPELNIVAQKPGTGGPNLEALMNQVRMEQTEKKYVDDPPESIQSLGHAMNDLVSEQTVPKRIDDEDSDDDLFDQTLVKQVE